MRPKTAVPTYRAGTNFRDQSRSGYARVDILGQEDLFPEQGYEFPPNARVPLQTRTYKVSEDSPFNCTQHQKMIKKSKEEKQIQKQTNSWMRTDQMCTRAAVRAIATPTPGELREINSKIAAEAVKKERDEQIRAREKIRLARMKDEAYWTGVEQREGISTKTIGETIAFRKQQSQRALADDYKQQFALHAKVKEEEKRQEQLEVQKMRQMEAEDAEKERKRQATLREIARERNREFQKRNEELMQRKEKRIEEDLAAEKIIQKQQEENTRRMEERALFERTRREEKNRIRNNMIEKQAKELAELKAHQQRSDEIAQSEIEKREEAERQRRLKRQEDMKTQRNKEWLAYQRTRDMRYMDKQDTPDFVNDDDDAVRAADALFRRKRQAALRQEQLRQIDLRRKREKDELEESRRAPDNMFFLKDNEW